MSKRTHEGPMDFEYQNGTGPIDSRSPFANVGGNIQRFPGASPERPAFKRPASSYGSPSRPSHAQPPSPSKARPPVPAFNALFSTPRKTVTAIDDSSAGETPKSPNRDDSDATPDTTALRSAVKKFDFEQMPQLPAIINTMEKRSPDRRDSLLMRIKKSFISPGRGEVPRGDMTHVKENRVKKIKSRDGRRRRRHSISSSASDDERRRSPRKSPRKATLEDQPSMIEGFFSFIGKHPNAPGILSLYAQLAFNVFLLSACAYWIYTCWRTIQQDVEQSAWNEIVDITAEINACAEHYRINGCASPTRVPALETVCAQWALCMSRDPTKIARARVTAHTFAEIFNSFIEPISWKAMIFTLLIVFGCFGISNFAFGILREKAKEVQHFPAYYPPPTPHRAFSGENAFYAASPWHPQQSLEPNGDFGQIEGRGSPVRRLAYS